MADIAIDNPRLKPTKRPSLVSTLLTLFLFFGAMMIAADFTAIGLRSLRSLQVPYVKAMDYAHLIIPASCALIWLATVRKWGGAATVATVVLCFVLVSQIPGYAQRRVARIPVNRFLTSAELEMVESRVAFPIFQQASNVVGNEVFVAPANEVAAREEMRRLGILSGRTGS